MSNTNEAVAGESNETVSRDLNPNMVARLHNGYIPVDDLIQQWDALKVDVNELIAQREELVSVLNKIDLALNWGQLTGAREIVTKIVRETIGKMEGK